MDNYSSDRAQQNIVQKFDSTPEAERQRRPIQASTSLRKTVQIAG
jgi:hypothetical protein